jgi:hypothetical protein
MRGSQIRFGSETRQSRSGSRLAQIAHGKMIDLISPSVAFVVIFLAALTDLTLLASV